MSLGYVTKDPDATARYGVQWSDYLDGDTISSVSWVVPAGITNAAASVSGTVAYISLSGGTANTDYVITCRMTSTGGVIEDQTFTVQVRA